MFLHLEMDAIEVAGDDHLGGVQEAAVLFSSHAPIVSREQARFGLRALEHLGKGSQLAHGRRGDEEHLWRSPVTAYCALLSDAHQYASAGRSDPERRL